MLRLSARERKRAPRCWAFWNALLAVFLSLCIGLVACHGGESSASDQNQAEEINETGDASVSQEADASDVNRDGGESEDGGKVPPPDGDDIFWGNCQEPQVLTSESGAIDLSWNAATSQGNHEGTCGGEGPEGVFMLSLERPALLDASLQGDVDGVLYVRKNCLSAQKEDQLACDDGLEFDHVVVPLAPGNHFIFVDAFSSIAEGQLTFSWALFEHPCTSVTCGHGAECQLSKGESGDLEPLCVCSDDFQIYSGQERGCLSDPCLARPCEESPEKECVYSIETLPDAACEERAWTILIFMNGDNNLYLNSVEDVREIQRATQKIDATGTSRVVILYDGPRAQDTEVVTVKNGKVRALPREATFLGEKTELNMSEGKVLSDFGVWALQNYPAKHVALVLWDHGSGWKNKKNSPVISQNNGRGFSNDVTSNPEDAETEIFLSTGEFSQALAAITASYGRKLDVVAFDACLMGMYEVALGVAPFADALLASEERIPAGGFDYERFLGPLFAHETAPQLGWLEAFPSAYLTISPFHYTMALTDLTAWEKFAAAFDAFAQALETDIAAPNTSENTVAALRRAQACALKFNTPSYVDLGDFALKLSQENGVSQGVQDQAQNLLEKLAQTVLVHAAHPDYAASLGLSVYLPEASETPDQNYFLDTAPWHQTPWTRVLQMLPVEPE